MLRVLQISLASNNEQHAAGDRQRAREVRVRWSSHSSQASKVLPVQLKTVVAI